MNIPHTAADVLDNHVTLEYESIDRMYLNLYVPQLQREVYPIFWTGCLGVIFIRFKPLSLID